MKIFKANWKLIIRFSQFYYLYRLLRATISVSDVVMFALHPVHHNVLSILFVMTLGQEKEETFLRKDLVNLLKLK